MNQYYPLTISALHIFAFFLKHVLEFRAKCKNSVTGDVRTSLLIDQSNDNKLFHGVHGGVNQYGEWDRIFPHITHGSLCKKGQSVTVETKTNA